MGACTDAVRETTVGGSAENVMRIVYDDLGLDPTPESMAESADWLHDYTGELFEQGLPWRPGAQELLETLAASEIPLALVTNKPTQYVGPLLAEKGLDAVVVDGDRVGDGPRDPVVVPGVPPQFDGRAEPTEHLECSIAATGALLGVREPVVALSSLDVACPHVRERRSAVDALPSRLDQQAALSIEERPARFDHHTVGEIDEVVDPAEVDHREVVDPDAQGIAQCVGDRARPIAEQGSEPLGPPVLAEQDEITRDRQRPHRAVAEGVDDDDDVGPLAGNLVGRSEPRTVGLGDVGPAIRADQEVGGTSASRTGEVRIDSVDADPDGQAVDQSCCNDRADEQRRSASPRRQDAVTVNFAGEYMYVSRYE